MREILGDVLGSNFSNISLKKYKKTLNKIEDKEDYETGEMALRDSKRAKELDREELVKVNEAIDVDTLVNALPLVYRFGLGMIEGFYEVQNLNLTSRDEDQEGSNNAAELSNGAEDEPVEVAGHKMKPPKPLTRESALRVMKMEQKRYFGQFYYKG